MTPRKTTPAKTTTTRARRRPDGPDDGQAPGAYTGDDDQLEAAPAPEPAHPQEAQEAPGVSESIPGAPETPQGPSERPGETLTPGPHPGDRGVPATLPPPVPPVPLESPVPGSPGHAAINAMIAEGRSETMSAIPAGPVPLFAGTFAIYDDVEKGGYRLVVMTEDGQTHDKHFPEALVRLARSLTSIPKFGGN